MHAVRRGSVECIKLIFAAGGDVNAVDDNGYTTADIAVKFRFDDCLSLLTSLR